MKRPDNQSPREQRNRSRLLSIMLVVVAVTGIAVARIVSATGGTVPARTVTPQTPLRSNVANSPTPESPRAGASVAAPEPATSVPDEVASAVVPASPLDGRIRTVFFIVMENHNWEDIKNSSSAPYINDVLLPQSSYANQYYNPKGIHPSEPNYLWLEAGTGFGISNDADPSANHQGTEDHLVTLFDSNNISWKAYVEGINGKSCPLLSQGLYSPKHNPMVYFDDITGGNDPHNQNCIAHERPYEELAPDLEKGSTARYNFIVPDLCDDMHNSSGCRSGDSIANGDSWLAIEVPKITSSQAYKDGGVLFISWDEGEKGSDGPIGMIVLSPFAKGGGYANSIPYTHSSTLRTVQRIFGVSPLLGDAANATDLADLFKTP